MRNTPPPSTAEQAPQAVAAPAFDQTWWFLATHLASTLREQRRLPTYIGRRRLLRRIAQPA